MFEMDKKRAEFVYGQPMNPCPKCGSYNMKYQLPIKFDEEIDMDSPKSIVAACVKSWKDGAELEGSFYMMCFTCFHKGHSLDVSGRTSEDVQSDPKANAEVKRLWNSQ